MRKAAPALAQRSATENLTKLKSHTPKGNLVPRVLSPLPARHPRYEVVRCLKALIILMELVVALLYGTERKLTNYRREFAGNTRNIG